MHGRTTRLLGLVVITIGCGARTGLLAEVSTGPEGGEVLLDAGEPIDALAPPDVPPPSDEAAGPPEDAQPDAPATLLSAPGFVWYRLDETSGTTAHDSSPHHYDVMNLVGVVWDHGATFNGAVCGSTAVGQAFRTAPVTMTAWLTAADRTDETVTEYALEPFPPNAVSGDAPSLGGFGLGINVWTDGTPGNGVALETGENAAIAFHTLAGIDAGVEYFLALVIGPSQADLYENGSLSASVGANTPLAAEPAPLHLGCHNDDTGYLSKRFFVGHMRDVRVYARLLGVGEIGALFASGPV